MLNVVDLCYAYEDAGFSLSHIHLEIRSGESVGILGENGSGKTTLVKNVMGLLRPKSGKIRLNGQDTAEMSVAEIARTVGFVFQNPEHQIFAASVEEEVRFGPENLQMDNIDERVTDVLNQTDLAKYRDTHPFNLSGGEKQRLALASVLVMDPQILILDEPTSGLDLKNARKLMEIVKDLQAQGKTLIAISHDMELIADLCERFVLMKSGEIIANGTAQEIFRNEELLEETRLELPEIAKLSKILGLGVVFDPDELYRKWGGMRD